MYDIVGKYVRVNLFNDYYHDGLYSEICYCDEIKDNIYMVHTIDNKKYNVTDNMIVEIINITNTQKFHIGSIVFAPTYNINYEYCIVLSCSIFANTINYGLRIISSGEEINVEQTLIRELDTNIK